MINNTLHLWLTHNYTGYTPSYMRKPYATVVVVHVSDEVPESI